MRVNTYFYFLTKELAFYGINVLGFRIRRPVAFMGLGDVNYEDYNYVIQIAT